MLLRELISSITVSYTHLKATKDTAYLYHINEETCSDAKITGIYYLQKKGNAGETNNYIRCV